MVTGRDMNVSVMVAGTGAFLIYASWADFSFFNFFARKQDNVQSLWVIILLLRSLNMEMVLLFKMQASN